MGDLPTLKLPTAAGTLEAFTLSAPRDFPQRPARPFDRIAYSAAHVVADARAPIDPWLQCAVDWDATIAYRRRLAQRVSLEAAIACGQSELHR